LSKSSTLPHSILSKNHYLFHLMVSMPRPESRFGLATPNQRHVRRHQRHERDACVQREAGHVQHGVADMTQVDPRFLMWPRIVPPFLESCFPATQVPWDIHYRSRGQGKQVNE
jgi:hypothetical protein